MAILLMLPGSPIPDWLLFLTPMVVLLLFIQGGQWLHNWYKRRLSHHDPVEFDSLQDVDGNNDI